MSETIFDKVSDAVAKNLSERPDAFADRDFLKRTAEPWSPAVQSDMCNRTPINQPLPSNIVAALNLALLAEYLETEFYSRGLNTSGLIPNDLRFVFTRILLNEVGHRETLLTVLGPNAIPKPTFDFTAGGLLPDVFSNFQTFVNLGRAFEDNGVRAIKGQAPNVMENDFILTTALRFHSVEARHASELRRIAGLKGWITLNLRGNLPAAFQGIYNGEENVVQLGINLTTIPGRRFSAEAVSESFDEPLTAEQVRANVRPFIVGGVVPATEK
jgi:hypothetical protein